MYFTLKLYENNTVRDGLMLTCRKDALPLGTFTKFTWHITNVLHVKQIFDTQGMMLDITRSFVENRDGTYSLYEPPANKVSRLNVSLIRRVITSNFYNDQKYFSGLFLMAKK